MTKNKYLGLDPSSLSTGWAVVNNNEELIDYGKIIGRTDDPHSFTYLHDELNDIFNKYKIKGVFIEDTFFSANIDTLKKIVRPSGIMLYMIGLHSIDKHKFSTPGNWRKTAFGKGNTPKKEVYEVVNKQYNLKFDSFNKYNDITDAIGIAKAAAIEFENEA